MLEEQLAISPNESRTQQDIGLIDGIVVVLGWLGPVRVSLPSLRTESVLVVESFTTQYVAEVSIVMG